jgi:hypothetical protein
MPVQEGVTIMDTIYQSSEINQRSIYYLDKLNFQQAPHNIEPIELLTIEAYQVRNDVPSKMTYFKNVKNIVSLRLNHHTFTDVHRHFVVNCCHFHGKVQLSYNTDVMYYIVTWMGTLLSSGTCVCHGYVL